MTSRRRGRPQKPEDQRLTDFLHVRVTAEEYDAACRKASAARMKLGDYLRRALRSTIFREHQIRNEADVS